MYFSNWFLRRLFAPQKPGISGFHFRFIVLFWFRQSQPPQNNAPRPYNPCRNKQKFVTTFNLFFKIALFLTHLVYCFGIYRTRVFLRVIVCIFPSETSLFHRLVIRNIFRLRSLTAALNRIKNLFPFGNFLY